MHHTLQLPEGKLSPRGCRTCWACSGGVKAAVKIKKVPRRRLAEWTRRPRTQPQPTSPRMTRFPSFFFLSTFALACVHLNFSEPRTRSQLPCQRTLRLTKRDIVCERRVTPSRPSRCMTPMTLTRMEKRERGRKRGWKLSSRRALSPLSRPLQSLTNININSNSNISCLWWKQSRFFK